MTRKPTYQDLEQRIRVLEEESIKSKQAEDALRDREAQYRHVIENAQEAIIITQDMKAVFVNRATVELTEYSADTLTSRPFREFIHPADRNIVIENHIKRLQGEEAPRIYSYRVIKRDGSIKWAETNSINIQWKGRPAVLSFLNDITERKKAEDALAESEERYRTILEEMEEGYQEVDLAGNYTFFNDAYLRVFGYSRDEMMGTNFSLYSAEEDMTEKIFYTFNQMYKTGIPIRSFEWDIIRKDGARRTLEYYASVLKDANGRSIGFRAIGRDITERKRAEEALQKSEQRYRLLVENANEAILVIQEGIVRFVNEKAVESFGYSKQEFMLIPIFELIHPDDREQVVKRYLQKIQSDATPTRHTYRALHKSGLTQWIEVSSVLIDWEGQPATMNLITDITERNRAEEKLQKEKEFSQTLVQSSPAFFVAISATGKIIMMNDALLQALGYTKDEVEDMNYLTTFVPENDREAVSKVFEQLMRLKKPTINENYILAKDGRRLLVEWHGRPVFKEAGELDYFFGVGINITDRRRMEEEQEKLQTQLTQAQKMESVGRLAGGVAHDFNNMLGVILGRAEIAMMKTDPAQSLYRDLQEIRKAAEHSADLTKQLLAFARKQTVTPKVLDLNEVVGGMLKMLRRLIGEDIDLAWLPDAALWPVKMDPSQIDQILANLCVNARDAIEGVGKVTIETGSRVFDEAYCADHAGFVPGDYVLLAVSDDGSGMSRETLDKLFEPFFTTKGVGKGTGLGLATVYGIVKQNNGFINVYSEPGHGTTFSIYLPRYLGKAEQLRKDDKTTPDTPGNETILFAEDEPAILEMTALMLEGLGYTVLKAATPGEAIRIAEEHTGKIDLLITDVVMPEMNGHDLARNILSLYPDIKRLFMSGYTANVIAHHGVLDKGVHFIQKPFSVSSLAAKVREALG